MDWNNILEPVEGLDTYLQRNLTRFQCLFYQCRSELNTKTSLDTTLGRSKYLLLAIQHVRGSEPELAPFFPEISVELEASLSSIVDSLPTTGLSDDIDLAEEATTRIKQLKEFGQDCDRYFATGLWRHHSIADYRKVCQLATDRLTEIHELSHPELPVPINRLMYALWKSRPDVQEVFPLSDLASQAGFVIWFIVSAPLEYRLYDLGLKQLALTHLNAMADSQPDEYPLTRAMALAACAVQHPVFPLHRSTSQSRRQFALWLYEYGLEQGRITPALLAPLWMVPGTDMKRALFKLSLSRPFKRGFIRHAKKAALTKINDCLQSLKAGRNRQPEEPGSRMHAPTVDESMEPASDQVGVTVIGPVCGTYGLGQSARVVSLALHHGQVPTEAYDLSPSFASCQTGREYAEIDDILTKRPKYNVNLFATNADFIFGLSPEVVRKLGFERKPSIWYGYWELPVFPAPWLDIVDMFDEIWAPTRFIKESIEAGLNREVVLMPPPVRVVSDRRLSRRDFGFPEEQFLFLFTYDALSHLTRKNPLALLDAFVRAFSPNDRRVGLVIKVKNSKKELTVIDQEIAKKLEELIASDSRIKVVDRHLTRSDFCDLISVCDCYVSLHRAEGFGNGMAEAMMLGKPVIATNYSGNKDFTTEETAFVVDYRLVPVLPGEYAFAQGQVWADPDLEHAASLMRTVRRDAELRSKISLSGQQFVIANHGLAATGRRYRERLELLCSKRQQWLGGRHGVGASLR